MNGLQIKNGQFVLNGEIVKPSFGNRDQILVLKHSVELHERMARGYSKVSLSADKYNKDEDEWEITAKFKCKCGHNVYHELLYNGYFKPAVITMVEHVHEETTKCGMCFTHYDLISHNDKIIALPEETN